MSFSRVAISPSDLTRIWRLVDAMVPPILRENLRLYPAESPSCHWQARNVVDDSVVAHLSCSTGEWIVGEEP